MKIAIDISQIVYTGTGVAEYTEKLVTSLLAEDSENEYILFATTLRQRGFFQKFAENILEKRKNVILKLLPFPQTIGNFLWNRLHTIHIEHFLGPIDVLHSSDWIQPRTRAKKVTTIHDLVVYRYPELSHPYIVETQKRRLSWVKKECDMVLADSLCTKKDLVSLLHFDPSRIEVVSPGINEIFTSQTEERKRVIKQKYRLPDEYILAVGTLEPRKNLKRVIHAFEKFSHHSLILSRKTPIELIITGNKGWGDRLPPGKYVRLLGFVEKRDLPALYSLATFFVYPSLYEGFGLPILEAMSCGCPVITSERGSLKEVAGDAAFLVDPEMEDDISSKMVKLYVDGNLREEFVKKGKINAERFSWQKTAREVLQIYKNLVS